MEGKEILSLTLLTVLISVVVVVGYILLGNLDSTAQSTVTDNATLQNIHSTVQTAGGVLHNFASLGSVIFLVALIGLFAVVIAILVRSFGGGGGI